jgi:hypothetical protein
MNILLSLKAIIDGITEKPDFSPNQFIKFTI